MINSWNHNNHYHNLILANMPPGCKSALDVGCGDGQLTRLLANRCSKVTGIDLDERILHIASGNSDAKNINYTVANFMTYAPPAGGFGFVTSVATLHHLPLRQALVHFKELVTPGGALVMIGLYKLVSLADYLNAIVALPISRLQRLFTRYETGTAVMTEPKQTLNEIRAAAQELLPGAKIKRLVFFRYSLIWQKPAYEFRISTN